MAKNVKKKKKVVVEALGQAHIHSSFNNIIISLTNNHGQVISWSSAGKMGFRGSKKNTPYAAQVAAEDCGKEAHELGLRKIRAFVKGPGAGREMQCVRSTTWALKLLKSWMLLAFHTTDAVRLSAVGSNSSSSN